MVRESERWALRAFCSHFGFVNDKMPDHAFAWVLGAGASRASGIPTGGDLVHRWLKELYARWGNEGETFTEWATAKNLGIKNFEYQRAAEFYTQIYTLRFRDHPEEGYSYLEDLMIGRDPSPGYSILAKMMESTRHRVAITTNFDNLIADALSIYTATYPFVCGHESLTGFARVAMRRPLVCKIHRDLLLGPKNDTRSLRRLHDSWGNVLRSLLNNYTPLFIGYGGNDDSLMDLLESLEPGEIKGRPIWTYHEKSPPSERITELMKQHNGVLVPIPDFDLLMVLIGNEIDIEPLDAMLEVRAKARAHKYREQLLALDTLNHPDAAAALRETIARAGGALVWAHKAKTEKDIVKKEAIYRQGLELFPEPPLYNQAACFLMEETGKFNEAIDLLQKAVAQDPTSSIYVCNLALAIWHSRKDNDEAEKLYRKAIELDPTNGRAISSLARVLYFDKGATEEAERLFRSAIEISPSDPPVLGLYAAFLIAQERFDEAFEYIEKAWQANSGKANRTAARLALWAGFLLKIKKKDASRPLGILKTIIEHGFNRLSVDFSFVTNTISKSLSPMDLEFFQSISNAVSDASFVRDLETSAEWTKITSIAMDEALTKNQSMPVLPRHEVPVEDR